MKKKKKQKSVTLEHQFAISRCKEEELFYAIDTVGFCDTGKSQEEIKEQLASAIKKWAPFHLIAYVLRCDSRLHPQEVETFTQMMKNLGPGVSKNLFLVFSHADIFAGSKSEQEEWLATFKSIPGGDNMLNMCGGRYIFYDCRPFNLANDTMKAERATVLRMARTIPTLYGFSFFSCLVLRVLFLDEFLVLLELVFFDQAQALITSEIKAKQAAVDAEAKRLQDAENNRLELERIRSVFILLFFFFFFNLWWIVYRRESRFHLALVSIN